MISLISKWILHLAGWTVRPDMPVLDKYVIIAAPHTSNWDFVLGILAVKAIKLDVQWIGKHTLFKWPFGWFFRALGGIPVYRNQPRDLIEQMQEQFECSEKLALALAPEGTRSKTDHWKTGFYRIAHAAGVPIVMAYLDFGRKEIGLDGAIDSSADIDTVFSQIREFYKGHRGKFPEKESLIQPRSR